MLVLASPSSFGAAIDRQDQAAGLPELLVDGFAHSLQQGRDIEEVIGSNRAHIRRKFRKIGIQREQAAAQ